jgi:thiol:disulfide interchange protein DsbA
MMAKWLFFLLTVVAPLAPAAHAAKSFEEGVHYHWVAANPSPGDQIEVVEFFWYGCPHCFSFEPYLDRWLENKPDDVKFVKLPATFKRPEVMMHARTFFALEAMGVPAQIHKDIMEEMHERKNRLGDQASMERFLESKGVDLAAFREAMESFAVYVKVQQAAQQAQRYNVSGVPALVVDGRFRNGDTNSYDEMVELLDYLVVEARRESDGQ